MALLCEHAGLRQTIEAHEYYRCHGREGLQATDCPADLQAAVARCRAVLQELEVYGAAPPADLLPAPPAAANPAPTTDEATAPVAWGYEGEEVGDEVTGPDGGAYVWLPPGGFVMGIDGGRDDEAPAHEVRITAGLWLGKHPVTVAQYRSFCAATGHAFPDANDAGDDHPVVYVSWLDACDYCAHYGLALPTEAQWEYGARGPTGLQYPWGDVWDPELCCSASNPGPTGRTCRVGALPLGASWCGAMDMAGNAAEWCADWCDARYYQHSPVDDPPGPIAGEERVLRGGSWFYDSWHCHCARRDRSRPERWAHCVGFRACIRPLRPPARQ